ncbi:hypothetical protein [Desulfobacter sp.]|uniref:hypothetical protein n=1 Tax=Desulfobacter sp. TaxID=2294 RepID=UPI003D0A6818
MTVIQSLFQEPNIRFEDGQAVWLALTDYRNAKPVKGKEADFADALIVNKSKQVANKENKPLMGLSLLILQHKLYQGPRLQNN